MKKKEEMCVGFEVFIINCESDGLAYSDCLREDGISIISIIVWRVIYMLVDNWILFY